MKQNKYDDEIFFEKYSNFPRSLDGLEAAGEWHELQEMLPAFSGKRVLDIGCGFGWHCIYAAQHGAQSVLGIDISQKMLAVAREKTQYTNVEYQLVAMEDMAFTPASFDVALSSLAFHYTADFEDICKRVNNCLTRGGDFVFSVEHPVFTAEGTQNWHYNEDGTKAFWPVDDYYIEGARSATFLGESVTKYHKTITTYINTLLKTGFVITGVVEPQPAPHLLNTVPDMQDELRRPMMLLISAKKL